MAGGPYANSNTWTGLGLETARGTVAVPTLFIPSKSPKITPTITEQDDDGLRGSMVKVYNQVPTVRHDAFDFTCLAYLDTLPALIRGILGGPDVITGTAPTVSHVMSLLNNDTANGNQPPSYTFSDFDGYQLRQMTAGQLDEVDLKFTATGLVDVTVKAHANPFAINGTVPVPTFSVVEAAPAWTCVATVAGTSLGTVVDGGLNLKRGVKPIHTLGQQNPYRLWAGPLDIMANLTVINTNDAELNYYLNNTVVPINLSFSSPSSAGQSFSFDLATCKVKTGAQARGSNELIETALSIVPLPNTADATAGGVSPVKFTAVNARATTY
jgi:hypothetical protein